MQAHRKKNKHKEDEGNEGDKQKAKLNKRLNRAIVNDDYYYKANTKEFVPSKKRRIHDKDEEEEEKEDEYKPTGPQTSLQEKKKVLKVKKQKQIERLQEAEEQAQKVEVLNPTDSGYLEAEGMERTFKFTQNQIAAAVDIRAARKIFDLKLDKFGPYNIDFTRNGRYLALAGAKGHISLLDWDKKTLVKEFHVKDAVRDVKFLHNETMFAVAQKRNVYIYDDNGVELHYLDAHADVNRLEFLPYHFLLVSASESGRLTYQDTSTGTVIQTCKTGSGALRTMCQNPRNAIIHLGQTNGSVTLWSPNSKDKPLVRMLCHKGPIQALTVDIMGQYMVTAGSDSMVRIWDLRTYQKLQHHQVASPIECLDLSQQNILALGSKKTVELFKDPFRAEIDKPYLDNRLNGSFVRDLRFCPYEDVLGVGHDKGYQSMLVPGAGIANYDTLEADPYATKFNRNEAEVKSLLEKIPADLISIDPDKLGEVVNETPWRNKEFKHPGLINIKRKNKPVSSEQVKIMDRESKRRQNEEKAIKDREYAAEQAEKKRTGTILDRFVQKPT